MILKFELQVTFLLCIYMNVYSLLLFSVLSSYKRIMRWQSIRKELIMCTCTRAVSFARFYFLTERTLCFGAVYRSTLMLERWKIKRISRASLSNGKSRPRSCKTRFLLCSPSPDIEFILPKLNTTSYNNKL